MGRRAVKKSAASLGRALVKDRFDYSRRPDEYSHVCRDVPTYDVDRLGLRNRTTQLSWMTEQNGPSTSR